MQDPTQAICEGAMALPNVTKGTSCNQTAFKTLKKNFLFIGPGPKGEGFKAMFKLHESIVEAQALAKEEPDRFKAGSSIGWVTVRFTAENPLSKTIWEKWLQGAIDLCCMILQRSVKHLYDEAQLLCSHLHQVVMKK